MDMNRQDNEPFYENIEAKKDHIRRIENSVRRKPTDKDLKESVKLLKEFGIKIDVSEIPDLRSVCELEKWRVRKICEYLDSH